MKKISKTYLNKPFFLENEGQTDLIKLPKRGDIARGVIINKSLSRAFVDLGVSGTGVIYEKEFQGEKSRFRDLKIGTNVFAKIIELENEEGYVELSLNQAVRELFWKELEQKEEDGEIIKVKILGANKGGLLATIAGVKGFLPTSQLSAEYYPRVANHINRPIKILEELKKLVGKSIEVKILNLEKNEDRIILSEKAAKQEKLQEIIKNKYKQGDVVEGEVGFITNFGVFLKIDKENNIEGLVHISELDWQLIENPNEIVKIGQKIKTKITEITENKILLSLKQLKKNPWEDIKKKLKKDDIVDGSPLKINSFGAFITLSLNGKKNGLKLQGLCHVSEFGTIKKMEESLKIGEKYKFKILSIDPEKYQIGLGFIAPDKKVKK